MAPSKIGVFLLLLTACDVQAQDATEAAKQVDEMAKRLVAIGRSEVESRAGLE